MIPGRPVTGANTYFPGLDPDVCSFRDHYSHYEQGIQLEAADSKTPLEQEMRSL